MQLIQAFEQLVSQAAAEHARAADREVALGRLLADARRVRADRDATRVRLADALELATVAADAAATRLGAIRGAVADGTRELEECADLAAAGDQGAAKPLARLADALATQRELLAAHQRRASALADARNTAERALADHDAAEIVEEGRQLEQLLLAEAHGIDQLLEAVSERTVQIFATFDRRRQLHPKESWPIDFTHSTNRFGVLLAAFQKATWGVNHASTAVGHTTAKSFMTSALSAVQSWQRGRGELEPLPDQAA